MNVLSLFNGMSFGMMALESLDIKVNKYYSSEIDKYANQATAALFPDTVQLGDVTKWREWDVNLGGIDLLLAGFPCQAWSMLGNHKGDNDPRGALVHELIDIWTEVKKHNPDVKFMFENVKMKTEFMDYINNLFGVDPICINSTLVSAQNRVRYYWTNINVKGQPEDKNINYTDVVEDLSSGLKPATVRKGNPRPIKMTGDKFLCLTATYFKGIRADGRPALSTGTGVFDDMRDQNKCRQLTPRECARLQTVPEYHIDTLLSAGISNTQLYKMLGNGWTMEVIKHIFKGLI